MPEHVLTPGYWINTLYKRRGCFLFTYCFLLFLFLLNPVSFDYFRFFSLNLISCIHFIATICFSVLILLFIFALQILKTPLWTFSFFLFLTLPFFFIFFYEHPHSFLLHSSPPPFFSFLLFHIVSLLYRHTTLERPAQLNFELHNL